MSKAPAILVSLFAQFVNGDIKGGQHAHAYRVATIQNAIEQMFKGNYSPITEAAALTEGKAKKARAYHAGFATFGVIGKDTKKVDYKGALNSADNKQVRDMIESQTKIATGVFFAAFDAVMAEKATPKTPKVETVAPVADEHGREQDVSEQEAAARVASAEQDADMLIMSVVSMLNNAVLSADQLESLGNAIRAAEARALLALPELAAA